MHTQTFGGYIAEVWEGIKQFHPTFYQALLIHAGIKVNPMSVKRASDGCSTYNGGQPGTMT